MKRHHKSRVVACSILTGTIAGLLIVGCVTPMPPDVEQLRYCGPNSAIIVERDRERGDLPTVADDLDALCGRSSIVLQPAEGTTYPETQPGSVTVFKSINHLSEAEVRLSRGLKDREICRHIAVSERGYDLASTASTAVSRSTQRGA